MRISAKPAILRKGYIMLTLDVHKHVSKLVASCENCNQIYDMGESRPFNDRSGVRIRVKGKKLSQL